MFNDPFSSVGPQLNATEIINPTHLIHPVVTAPEPATIKLILPQAKGFTGFMIFIGESEEEPPKFEVGNAVGIFPFQVATIMVTDGGAWWPVRTE